MSIADYGFAIWETFYVTVLSADLLQRRADQFFIRHKWALL